MGRRLNVSTPTVINTELVPLDESFYIDVDGQMEQWYYDNTEQYAPNRKITPLLLVPVISAFDKDTSTSYAPTFQTTQWFANEWDEAQGKYVETEITNQVESGSADYVIQGNNLLVKKNVSYSHAVSIRCVATYIDPRDSGVTYAVEDSVNLTTNRTADVVFPEVDIISPSGRAYNPLVDDHTKVVDGETVQGSIFKFKGVTTNNPVQPMNTDVRRYPVDVDGTEEILNSGEAVAPIMDIRYGNNPTSENQEFMCRQTAGRTLVGESINKAYIECIKGNTVAWNQLMANGNFESNHNWNTTSYGTASISSGVVTIIANTTNKNAFEQSTGVDFVNGHKYYGRAVIQSGDSRVKKFNFSGVEFGNTSGTDKQSVSKIVNWTFGTNRHKGGFRDMAASDFQAFTVYSAIVIDLTLIYGAGNEPETVEEFEADYERWFGKPLSYEEYDEGSLRPVLMQSVKTTGLNQWDEEWEVGCFDNGTGQKVVDFEHLRSKNRTKVIPNTVYFSSKPIKKLLYDADGNYLGNISSTVNPFTTPENCHFIAFNTPSEYGITYNHDICINISNPSKNGTYEPYEEKVQGFDVTAIKGKLNGAGNSVTVFSDGLKKAGNVQDEIFVEDGVVKAIKRVGSVDLGTLTWFYSSGYGFYSSGIDDKVNAGNNYVVYNLICSNFIAMARNSLTTSNNGIAITDSKAISASSTMTSSSDFKAAINGVMLYYELATPETYVLDPITDFVWYGIENGQEVLADTLPWYVSGQGTDTLVVDAMYGEYINVVLRCKMMDGETLSPSKAYATLNWRTPDIETFVQSDNGGAVRSDTKDMTFDTIVNVNGDVLTDALKQKHLAFNWKICKNNSPTVIDKGWGQRITIDASDLRNVKQTPSSTLASTNVGNEVYLKGAYEEVTDNGEVVTDGGEVVYDRPVD